MSSEVVRAGFASGGNAPAVVFPKTQDVVSNAVLTLSNGVQQYVTAPNTILGAPSPFAGLMLPVMSGVLMTTPGQRVEIANLTGSGAVLNFGSGVCYFSSAVTSTGTVVIGNGTTLRLSVGGKWGPYYNLN